MRSLTRFLPVAALSALLVLPACSGGGDTGGGDTASGDRTGGNTAQSASLKVGTIQLGKAIGPDRKVTAETDDFTPFETVYASVSTVGSARNATVTARWTFEDGQVVGETKQAVSQNGEVWSEFHLSRPGGLPKGEYKIEILLNEQILATKEFEIS